MRFAKWFARRAHRPLVSGQQSRRIAVPRLEALEDRVTPSTLIPVTDYRDLVFDPGRDLLYITTKSGEVQRWDVAGQQLLSPWNVGTSLEGADITPDGNFLYVGEDNFSTTQGLFHEVNLSNGSVVDLPYSLAYNEGGSWDIAISSQGKGLVSTQAPPGDTSWLPLRQLDTSDNTYTTRTDVPQNNGIAENTLIGRSADRSTFLVQESNRTDGPFFLYNASTDTISSWQETNSFLGPIAPAINHNGTLFAIVINIRTNCTSGLSIFDDTLHSVQNLAGLTGGDVFDSTQDILYGVNPTTNEIQAYDTNTWALKYSIPIGDTTSENANSGPENMAVSLDGKYLFLGTSSGVREYSLPQATGVASLLNVTGFPAFITKGVPGALTVTAEDPAGNIVTNYAGTIHFASTAAGSLPADYTFAASDNGAHTFTLTLNTTGTQTLTVTDQSDGISGSQSGIVVHDLNTNYIPVADTRDLVYDATRNILYITAADGTLQRYDVATQTLLAPIPVGASLNGADITPDDGMLYAGDDMRGATQGWFHVVNLTTGAVTNLPYTITIPYSFAGDASWDVVAGPDGQALADDTYDGHSWAPVQQIDTSTNTLSARSDTPGPNGTILSSTRIARSADRSLFVFTNDISYLSDECFTYSPSTDTFSQLTQVNFTVIATQVNRNGTLIATDDSGVGVVLFDPTFNVVKTLSSAYGGLCFDPTQDILYIADENTNNLLAYDTNTWSLLYKIPIGEDMGNSINEHGAGTMTTSSDGSLLFLATPTEIRIFHTRPTLSVSGFPSPINAGTPGTVTVTAVSPDGSNETGYTGTIHFSSSDQQAGLPADYTFTAGDNGSHTFSVILMTAGVQWITANDTANGMTGSETGITVRPGAPDHLAFSVQPSDTMAGTVIEPTVTVQEFDKYENLETGDNADQVTLSVASGPGDFADGSTTTMTVGGGIATFSNLVLDTAGIFSLGQNATGGIGGPNSTNFTVNPAAADHLGFSVQPSDTTAGTAMNPVVEVQEFDKYGNVLTGNNSDQVTLAIASGPGSFASESAPLVTVQSGVASFNYLVLDTAGTYTIAESATGGISGPVSISFTIRPAAPDHLSFSVQPSNTEVATTVDPPVQVDEFDRYGNLETLDNSNQATLSVASGPGGFDSATTTTITVSAGIATFSNLAFDAAGIYVLGETDTGGVTGANSSSFSIIAPVADHLAFGVQPSDMEAGYAINPAVQVKVLNQFGDLFTGDNTDQVSLSVASGPGGIDSGSSTTVTVNGGIATFSNLIIDTAGSYTLGATTTSGVTGPNSNSFSIIAPVTDNLVFSVQPSNTTSGIAISPAVQVKVFDQFGNFFATDNSDQVTLNVASGPGVFTSGSTTTITVKGGIARFSNLVLNTAGTYTLGASSGSVTGPNSSSFTVTAGAPDHLSFAVQPSNTTAGSPIAPAVRVKVFDKFGNLETGDNSDQVTLTVASGTGGFAPGSKTTVTVSGGTAIFSNLVFDNLGTYTLADSLAGGVTGPNSNSFTVSPTTAYQLAFSVQPSDTIAGSAISPVVQVQVLDRFGNLLAGDNTDQVHLSIASGPGDFVNGTQTVVTVSAGIATFNNLIIDTAGIYTFAASATGLNGVTSNSFTIIPAAGNHIAFSVQPSNSTAGAAIAPSVQVKMFDRFGNLATNDSSDPVTLSVASGPGGFTSDSTSTVTVSSGVATFSNLILATVGTYTLAENAEGEVTGPNSSSFTISVVASPKDHLTFTVPPSDTTAGTAISPAVQVNVYDPYGNLVTTDSSDQVTLSVASGPGTFTSGSTTTVTVNGGVANFDNLVFDTAGVYTLSVSSGGMTGATSTSFTVSAVDSANHLGFSVQPGDTAAGSAISPSVQVEVLDRFGNLITSDNSDQVTLSVGSGPGGFTADSTTTVTVSGGIATFANLILDTAGTYSLAENGSSGLTGPNSNNFTVNPLAADHLRFGTQPSTSTAGVPINPTVKVQLFDRFGNLATLDYSDQVTLSVAGGPAGFTSDSTTTVTVSQGVASFDNLILDTASSYTLAATATGNLTGPDSGSFTVNPAPGDHLSFSVGPTDTVAGRAISPALQVEMFDRFGNLLANDNSDQVSVLVVSAPGGFTQDSTSTVTVSGGIAVFSNLILDTAGTYILGDTATVNLIGPDSNSFTVSPTPADHLGFSVQPGDTKAGKPISPAVQVQVLDKYGNLVPTDNSDQVSLSVAGGSGGFTSGSTTTATVSGGIATFSNLVLDSSGTYNLGATAGVGLTAANSRAFTISAAVDAHHLSFSEQPGNTTAGNVIGPAVQVEELDSFGNLVSTDSSDPVSIGVSSGPGGFASGTTTITLDGGIATFTDLVIDKAGPGYTLTAFSDSLPSATSNTFSVTAAVATHQLLTAGPPSSFAASSFFAVAVTAEDNFGNVDTSFNSDETIALTDNPGGSRLAGTLSATASNGVTSFSGLMLNKPGSGYQVEVSTPGLAAVTTNTFDVTAGAATQLVLVLAPTGLLNANAGFNVQLVAEDAVGNVDPSFDENVQVTLASDPAGGVLGGTLSVPAQAGLISFSGLTLSQGGPYGLTFGAGTLTPATLNVTALAFQRLLPSVPQDATAPAGVPVSTLLLSNYSDSDAVSKPGIAVTQTSGTGIWQYSANGKSWFSIGSVSPTQARLLPATYQIRFVPGLHWLGSASLMFAGWDGSQGTAGGLASSVVAGGTSAFSLASAQANLTVTPVNHAPTWLPGSAALTPILPGGTSPTGDSITSIFGGNFSDVDSGTTVGVAVVGLTGAKNGIWQYALGNSANWQPFGTPSVSGARLLSGNDQIRFLPNSTNSPGMVTLQAYAWDGTTGTHGTTGNLKGKGKTGGLSVFSTTPIKASFAINDAPMLSSATGPTLSAIPEDSTGATLSVSTLLTNEIDPDDGAQTGAAIVAASGPGIWQYSLNGKNWQPMGAVSEPSALLLASTAQIRFVPGLHQVGQATLTYRAWDQTAGLSGTRFAINGTGGAYAFSSTEATVTINVPHVNHAPTWTSSSLSLAPVLPGTNAPVGDSIADLFGGDFSDIDGGTTPGIAVTNLSGLGGGSWQYSLDGGSQWRSFASVNLSTALLLSNLDQIRFMPNGGFSGTASLQAYAWDGSSGSDNSTAGLTGTGTTGASTSFSTSPLTVSVVVNTAPTLDSTGPALTASNATSVTALLSGVQDADSGALKGVAVVGASGPGTWQFSLDGRHWQALGAVSETLARLLPVTAQLRLQPGPHQSGQATLTYRAWDQTAGAGGTLFAINGTGGAFAFSSTEALATLAVTQVHHAPTWTGSGAALTPLLTGTTSPAGDSVASIFGAYFNVDAGGATPGIAVTGLTGSKNGVWQYLLASGTWTDFGSVSTKAARLLSGSDLIRFVPSANFSGTVSLQAYAWDHTSGHDGGTANLTGKGKTGASTAFSTTTLTATCVVNKAPVLEA